MLRFAFNFIILLFICSNAIADDLKIISSAENVILTGTIQKIHFSIVSDSEKIAEIDTTILVSGLTQKTNEGIKNVNSISFKQGSAILDNIIFTKSGDNEIIFPGIKHKENFYVIPGFLSLFPPIAAILLALIFRQVLVALLVGIWIGASIIYDFNPFKGLLYALTEYIAKAPADPDKMAIIVFSLVLGGMVGVISKMGGSQGIVEKLSQFASNRKRGQISTWLMGLIIFFDDYANTLIVGNTMRPLTDKLKISREKLAYLVDSTAAPVANIAVISTWIGFELSLIASSFNSLGITDNAYITFFKTIPYNFYPIFALSLGFFIALLNRDFGAMYKAEMRAFKEGKILRDGATPISSLDTKEMTADNSVDKKWFNGLIPIAVVIATTLIGLWLTGLNSVEDMRINTSNMGFVHYISTVIGNSNSYSVLMWAAFFGSFIAIFLAVTQKILNLEQSISAWIGGVKAMIIAALILTLAWSIGNICNDLKTADYVIYLSEGFLSPAFLPLLSFIIAAVISFATGTSWGVMAILMPIVIPLGYLLPQADLSLSLVQQNGIFLSTIGSVLAGATFGDHCSPISDTTIMSSMASGSDHVDHVRTQLPYALVGGIVSMIFGYLPVGFGINPFISLIIGVLCIFIIVRYVGKKIV